MARASQARGRAFESRPPLKEIPASNLDAADLPPLLTVKQVAKACNVFPTTVYRWAADGTLPVQRLGKKLIRFRLADVRRFVNATA